MATPVALACIRCGARYPLADSTIDCPACRPTAPSNLTVVYDRALAPLAGLRGASVTSTLWRYADALPVDATDAVSLGEGMTPLVALPATARDLGVSALLVKDESRNPTWSFKDRLATVAVSVARRLGARVVASSSSGNAGAAVAAYAARAGLPCVVFTFQGAAGPMVTQMRGYGAMVLAVKDKSDRWTLLEAGVREHGWFPTSAFFAPAVGSTPFGLEGYKTLAYEIVEQQGGRAPDWCVLPVCYGDALFGMWKGFEELRTSGAIAVTPRLAAAEIYGSLSATLATGRDDVREMPKTHDTIAVSIGATRSTFQALHALRASHGEARVVTDGELIEWQTRLAATEGLWLEASSVAPLAAVRRLRDEGVMAADARVVVVATAGGLKDPGPMTQWLGEAPLVEPRLDAVRDALEEVYGFTP